MFGTPKDIANITAGLAANQGFCKCDLLPLMALSYTDQSGSMMALIFSFLSTVDNGILAAGLIWALAEENVNDKAFFLAGVIVRPPRSVIAAASTHQCLP